MSADSVPSSKTNIFQSKLYTLIYCRHIRTYSRCAMFDWSDTVFRRRNVTRRRISNTVLQPRYWRREADSPEVCRLIDGIVDITSETFFSWFQSSRLFFKRIKWKQKMSEEFHNPTEKSLKQRYIDTPNTHIYITVHFPGFVQKK